MGNPDLKSCAPGEYGYYEEERVREGFLSVGVYTLMLMLQAGGTGKSFKCPSLVDGAEEDEDVSGLYMVRFNLLDRNSQPVVVRSGPFDDGYFRTAASGVAEASYFIGDGDECEQELQEMVANQGLSPAGGQVWPRY